MNAGSRVAQERLARKPKMSQQELADKVTRLGYEISQTGIDKIEKRDQKHPKCLTQLAKALGVTEQWLSTGKGPRHPEDRHIPSEEIARELSRDEDAANDNGLSSGTRYEPKVAGGFPEVDARAGAGSGTVGEMQMVRSGDQTVIGHKVITEWMFPKEYLRFELKASPNQVMMMEVIGDSMSPTLQPGDRIVVDYSHTRPTPDGLYVIDEGEGPQVKRIQMVRQSEPAEIEIISDNPHHKAYRLLLETIAIIGRVSARITRT